MDYTMLLYGLLSMGGLGFFFAVLIAIANKRLQIKENPLITQVESMLPGVNCGSCGYPGCSNFAENLVTGQARVSQCPVSDQESKNSIAKLLGVEASADESVVAVVHCQGTKNATKLKAQYVGVQTCLGATLAGGGERACSYGCLGLGDCVVACPFDAIHIEDGVAVVDRKKCTGCGVCVAVCPRKIIELHPRSHRIFVLCKNKDNSKTARNAGSCACIGCGICVKAVGGAGFEVVNNLAQISYDKLTTDPQDFPLEKCPAKAIAIVDDDDTIKSPKHE